jgi:hypothetical protein
LKRQITDLTVKFDEDVEEFRLALMDRLLKAENFIEEIREQQSEHQ